MAVTVGKVPVAYGTANHRRIQETTTYRVNAQGTNMTSKQIRNMNAAPKMFSSDNLTAAKKLERSHGTHAARFVIDADRGTVAVLDDILAQSVTSKDVSAHHQASLMATERVVVAAHRVTLARATSNPRTDWIVAGFLQELLAALEPGLRLAMRSRNIVFSAPGAATVALRSDGIFVQIDAAQQEDVIHPVQVARLYPDLREVLDTIRRQLRAAGQISTTSEVGVVLRQAHAALDAELVLRQAQAALDAEIPAASS